MSIKQLTLFYSLAVILQFSLLNLLSINGYTPHLVLCLSIVIIFVFPMGYKAVPFGLVAMILLDMLGARYVGISALLLMVVGAIVLIARRNLNTEKWLPMLTTGLLSTAFFYFFYWVIMKVLQGNMVLTYFLKGLPWRIFYDNVIILILFFLFLLVIKRREKNRYGNE